MVIAYFFCLGDLRAVLESQATLSYPFLYVFQTGTGSIQGAVVLGLIIVVLRVCSTVSALVAPTVSIVSLAKQIV